MYKRISIVLLAFIFVFLVAQFGVCAYSSDNVIDNLGYLTESEVLYLQGSIERIKDNYRLDTVIVITDDTQGKSSRDYADDYFDYNGYGVGSDYSGLLLLINMDKREAYISTNGKAIDIFTDKRIDNILDDVAQHLSKRDYYQACCEFINNVKSYANSGVPSNQYRVDTERNYFHRVLTMIKSFPVYIVALVISVIATLVVTFSSKERLQSTIKPMKRTVPLLLRKTETAILGNQQLEPKLKAAHPVEAVAEAAPIEAAVEELMAAADASSSFYIKYISLKLLN